MNFHPSIWIKLFTNPIEYAKKWNRNHRSRPSNYNASQKNLTVQKQEPWVKKSGTKDFDVPVGCYDGAEVCEFIYLCIYLIKKLQTKTLNSNI